MNTIIIGLGNPVLTDDSVGLKISAALRQHLAGRPGVTTAELYSGGLRLVEAIAGFDRAIVLDAIVTGQPAGTIRKLGTAELPSTRSAYSAHDGSLPAALQMGRMAGLRLPDEIDIWAVEAGDVETFSESLTPAVARAVPQVVREVLDHLDLKTMTGQPMKTAVYFCKCGTNLSPHIDVATVSAELLRHPDVAFVTPVDFLCAGDGRQFLRADLEEKRPDRVVIAACSPREYQSAFMGVLEQAGINPYYLQMANIREQVAWVTPRPEDATAKACAQIRGAVARVRWHEPLEKKQLEVCRDVLVIGAGPAGLKCALTLAEAGRKVVLVEKSPALGGMPVRYEELFPNLECAPCMLEPVLGEVMHGPHAANIEILTLAEVSAVTGYYGNFTVKIRRRPRYVDIEKCIGCQECVAPCPVTVPNEFNFDLDGRKALAFPFPGALPNVPFLDGRACLRHNGEECTLCRDACPVPDAILYDQAAGELRTAGRGHRGGDRLRPV